MPKISEPGIKSGCRKFVLSKPWILSGRSLARGLRLGIDLLGWRSLSAIIVTRTLGPGVTVTVTAITTATATASTSAPTSSSTAAAAAVVLLPGPPIIAVALEVVVTATTAGTTVELLALPKGPWGLAGAGLHLALLDQLVLLLDVRQLGHDLQVVSLPLGLRVEGQESLGGLLSVELNEDGALEEEIRCSSQTEGADWGVLTEESLKVELGGSLLFTKALNIYSDWHLVASLRGFVGDLARDQLFALVARDVQVVAIAQSLDDGLVGLETTHAAEGGDLLEGNRVVLEPSGQLPHVLVLGKVAVSEVELDLV
jgi:hypothetical protein